MPDALTQQDIQVIVSRVQPEAIIRRTKHIIRNAVGTFGDRAVQEIAGDLTFNVSSPSVQTFMNRWGTERITTKVNQTTRRQVRNVLVRGVEEGLSTEKIASNLQHVFDVADASRAREIANTEIARASNFATLEGYEQSGIEQKEWLATQDDVVRDTHADADGQIVDINEDFVLGGSPAPYPGETGDPAEDVNCRCGIIPVVGERRYRMSRYRMWKVLERQRSPYDRRMRTALRKGFRAQESAVLAEFNNRVRAIAA